MVTRFEKPMRWGGVCQCPTLEHSPENLLLPESIFNVIRSLLTNVFFFPPQQDSKIVHPVAVRMSPDGLPLPAEGFDRGRALSGTWHAVLSALGR